MASLIGIDIGGTNLRLGVVQYIDGQMRILEELRFKADFSTLCQLHQHAPNEAWQPILNIIADAVNKARVKHTAVSAVGIGFPGFIDPHTQKISQSPNLPGLSNVDLSADLSALINLPVATENDALAAAYGEFMMLCKQKASNDTDNKKINHLLYLGLGTGVGGGLILNGQPYPGQHGVAMEVGHIITTPNGRLCGCGNYGCMEQYASASGVSKSYAETTQQQLSAKQIASLANTGDVYAKAAYQTAGASLALALAHVLKVIDVTDIIIGGGMSAGWELMKPAFQQQLNQDLIPVLRGKLDVRISNTGDQAGMIGAAMLAHLKV